MMISAEEFMARISDSRDYLLAQASRHEQKANYAAYIHDRLAEESHRAEQRTLLRWAEALDLILTGDPLPGATPAGCSPFQGDSLPGPDLRYR